MSTVSRVFVLKRSRFAFAFQLFVFISLTGLLYSLLPWFLWLISLLSMLIAWFQLLKQPQLKHFEYLDDQFCSFSFSDELEEVQQRKIRKMIDHQCYIVICFYESQCRPCVIWWDQLSILQWKKLKKWVKLV
ncbi:hypothetical protein F2A31_02095 [Acinetobacter suaedae]|uniref:Uncharacterized protein n=1 Tax=Acinetobacter suaedae TaxID=2609668 RepID=A0A5P1URW4_9GAMM|nr:hypothetical protein [Acinetobacter sp. C16S1]QER38560.1 hypothetical protein F2A31_02095 [Acinetobacter sp. C16S1]